jgi:hypothetical protein
MFDLLPDRRAFFRSEFHSPRHSTGTRSRSTYTLPLAVPRGPFQSGCPFPSLVTGQRRVLWPSKQPISLWTQHQSDSSYSLRRIRMLPSRRRTHPYLPCVRIFIKMVHAISWLLARTDGAGVDIFKQSAWVEALPRQQRSWFILPSGRTPWACCFMPLLSLL